MRLNIADGKYVVAVSGGVDSVVLLDLLAKLNKQNSKARPIELIVAHFDHGIRPDSKEDRLFVAELAKAYGLPFKFSTASLGPNASEEIARNARYDFLNKLVKDNMADGLITAHHQDDLVETATLNIIRGTGRHGLTALKSTKGLVRPLLKYPKSEIITYAVNNNLSWREDSTNQDIKYSRNYLRHRVLPKIAPKSRIQLLDIIDKQYELNDQIDDLVAELLSREVVDSRLPRLWFSSLDRLLSREILAAWLRLNGLYSYDYRTLERLAAVLKVAKTGSHIDAILGYRVGVKKDYLALEPIER